MRLQSAQSGCGPSSVANILNALGWTHASEDWVAKRVKLASSVNDPHPGLGTTEFQIRRCLSALKIPHFELTGHTPQLAVSALRGQLVLGHPALLAVDNDDHWVAAVGVLGSRFSVVDSADSELNVFYAPDELAQRWATATDPARFYALVVTGLPKGRRK